MTKRLPNYTFVNRKQCLTETIYKGKKIYKVRSSRIEYYQILDNDELKGFYSKQRYAKEQIDKGGDYYGI